MSETRKRSTGTLAERLLEEARDSHGTMSLYLVSGFQLKGEILGFDDEAILFHHRNAHQLVMRSAVASMYPLPDSRQDGSEWWREYASDGVEEEPDGQAPS